MLCTIHTKRFCKQTPHTSGNAQGQRSSRRQTKANLPPTMQSTTYETVRWLHTTNDGSDEGREKELMFKFTLAYAYGGPRRYPENM